jgi:hypothetical protein
MVFVDESGKSVKTAASEMLSISDLGYVYSGVPRVAEALPPGKRAFAMTPPLAFQATAMANADPKWEVGLERAGSKFTASVVDVPQKLRKALDRVALEEEPPPVSTRLIIEDMMVDPKVTFGVRVYLNCPNLEKDPGPKDPHFVGNVFFFGLNHRPLGHTEKSGRDAREVPTSAILDLTHTLRGLGKAGVYEKDKPFDVQCLAIPIHEEVKPQVRVRFREFRLEVASNV